ncbi:MAG: hypothetical protein K6G69_02640 [Lachnospiraceae bacterium]|nr:hypothetical protein [Lachnospiraceae bacterium]
MRLKNSFKDKLDIVIAVIIIALFGFFMFGFEVVVCGDSFQYEHQMPMREPVYSLLLQFLQLIKGEEYTILLGPLQNILAMICVYFSYRRLYELFGFKVLFRIATALLLLVPHIITPLFSKTHIIITNNVMTEGITISIYYVWFTLLLCILRDFHKDRKTYTKAVVADLILALILAMTRGQMLVCLVVLLIVMCFKTWSTQTEEIKTDRAGISVKTGLIRTSFYILTFFLIIGIKTQLTKWYNLAESGCYVNTVSSKPMLLANIAYVCDEGDARYIKDPKLREAFTEIMRGIKFSNIGFDSAKGGIIDKAKFHESNHEIINFEHIDPALRPVIMSKYGITEARYNELMIREDELCGEMAKDLLPHVFGKYLKNYFVIASLGFVRTIAVERSILPLYSLVMYISALIMAVWLTLRKRTDSASVMLVVLLTICGTVFGTSLVIQCIARYMIYGFPFFYIAFMVMLKETQSLMKRP